MKIPRHFPKWDKKTDGLKDAGLWALDYERSRLPADMVIPRAGQIWEAVRDCEVAFRAYVTPTRPIAFLLQPSKSFSAFGPPDSYMKQFGTTYLRSGERVRVSDLGEPKPINITFAPLRYEELQESIVPPEVRNLPGYRGYTLSAKAARTVSDFQKNAPQTYFNVDFRLVEGMADLPASKD